MATKKGFQFASEQIGDHNSISGLVMECQLREKQEMPNKHAHKQIGAYPSGGLVMDCQLREEQEMPNKSTCTPFSVHPTEDLAMECRFRKKFEMPNRSESSTRAIEEKERRIFSLQLVRMMRAKAHPLEFKTHGPVVQDTQ